MPPDQVHVRRVEGLLGCAPPVASSRKLRRLAAPPRTTLLPNAFAGELISRVALSRKWSEEEKALRDEDLAGLAYELIAGN